jgi:hypothetical protein
VGVVVSSLCCLTSREKVPCIYLIWGWVGPEWFGYYGAAKNLVPMLEIGEWLPDYWTHCRVTVPAVILASYANCDDWNLFSCCREQFAHVHLVKCWRMTLVNVKIWMNVSPLVAAHSSAPTQKEATTVAVFLGTLWNRTSIPARPLVRQVLFIFPMYLDTVQSLCFQLYETIVCFILYWVYVKIYLFPTNHTFCWLTFALLPVQHVSANNNSHPQGEHWHSFVSTFSKDDCVLSVLHSLTPNSTTNTKQNFPFLYFPRHCSIIWLCFHHATL